MKTSTHTAQRFKKYIVDISNFKILQKINSGGFGAVYSVEKIKTGEKFAAKVLNDHKDESKYKIMINREIGIMIRCNHPTIINLIGYSFKDFHDENNITIIMELAQKGSLAELLQKSQNGLADDIYDNTIRQIILIGIARGMMYLHEHKIIHRDLKPGNILLDEDFHPHITDFGLSKLSESSSSISQSQQCGTIAYMAPEVIEGNKYSGKADVYSFGILMYEVITDLTPYPELNKGKITVFKFTNMIINNDHRPSFKFPIKKSIKKLIERCWSKNPSDRPTFEDIFKKLAYNIEDEVDDIYDSHYDENKDEDDNKYYLEGVDVDDVASYIDDIDFHDVETMGENNDGEKKKLINHIKKLEDSIENLKEQFNQLKIENINQKALIDDAVANNQIDLIKKENEELKKQILDLKKENENQKKKIDNEILAQLNLIKSENDEIKKENKQMKDKIAQLEKKSDTEKTLTKNQSKKSDSIKPSTEKVDKISIKAIAKESDEEPIKNIPKESNKKSSEKVDGIKKEPKSTKSPQKDIKAKPNKASTKTVNIKADEITVKCFNNLSLQLQKNVSSQLKSSYNKFFKKIDDLLGYVLDFCDPGANNQFKINSFSENSLLVSMSNEDRAFLLYPAVESLNKKNAFNAPSFCNLLFAFDQITIELKYPSENFDTFYRNVSTLKNENKEKSFDFRIFISNIETTDDRFRNSTDINSVIFDSSVNSIESKCFGDVYYGSFSNCSLLENITIPSSIRSIDPFSFDKCISLKQISIPFSITVIPQYAFRGCTSLEKVELPYMYVIEIGMAAFNGCSSLKSIEIPLKVKVIEKNTFNGCTSLNKITIPPGLNKIGAYAFNRCTSLIQIQLPSSLSQIEAAAFKDCKALSEFMIPGAVNIIEKSTFFGCSSLVKISIPRSVESIGFGAFTDCVSLEEVTIPSNVNLIGDFCFKNCAKLSKISIDEDKTKVSKNTFSNCKLLHLKH